MRIRLTCRQWAASSADLYPARRQQLLLPPLLLSRHAAASSSAWPLPQVFVCDGGSFRHAASGSASALPCSSAAVDHLAICSAAGLPVCPLVAKDLISPCASAVLQQPVSRYFTPSKTAHPQPAVVLRLGQHAAQPVRNPGWDDAVQLCAEAKGARLLPRLAGRRSLSRQRADFHLQFETFRLLSQYDGTMRAT